MNINKKSSQQQQLESKAEEETFWRNECTFWISRNHGYRLFGKIRAQTKSFTQISKFSSNCYRTCTIEHGWGFQNNRTIDRTNRSVRPSSRPNCRRLHQTPLDLFGRCVYGWRTADVPCLFDTDLMWTLQSRSAWSQSFFEHFFGKSAWKVKDRKIIWINTHQRLYHAQCDENHLLLLLLHAACGTFCWLFFVAFFLLLTFFWVCVCVLRCTGFTISSFGHVSWTRCTLSSTCELITCLLYMREDQITDLFFPCNRHLFDDSMERECSMVWRGYFSVPFVELTHSKKTQLEYKKQMVEKCYFGYFSIKWALKRVSTICINWSRWKFFCCSEKQFCTHDLIDHLLFSTFIFTLQPIILFCMIPNKKCDIWQRKKDICIY